MEEEINELQKEIGELIKEWNSIVEFAEHSLYNYSESKTMDNIEGMEYALTWLLDHVERFDECRTKVDILNNKESIRWN
jgi:hypothetical protein